VFRELWRQGWLAIDGAMGKAPLSEQETGPNPTERAKRGTKKSLLTDGRGAPLGVAVAGPNVVDFKLMSQTLQPVPVTRSQPTKAEKYGLTLHLRNRSSAGGFPSQVDCLHPEKTPGVPHQDTPSS
jgi:putative transposase